VTGSPRCLKAVTPLKSRRIKTPPNAIHITDPRDPRLRPYTALKDRQLAAEAGLFVCEGEHNVRRLLASKYQTVSLLIAEHRLDTFLPDLPDEVTVYTAPNGLLSDVVGFRFHLGVLACAVRPVDKPVSSLLPARTLVVLPEIRNAENLGLIVRAAHGLGADGMLLSDIGCDPFTRRVIRVSMGSVFGLPIVRSRSLADDLNLLRDAHGLSLVAAVLGPDAQPLDTFTRPAGSGGVALVLGNEPDGLGPRWARMCSHKVTIPMSAGVDSLNVAVAAGILLHHLSR
jgi:tRNA G18 (ribose-2'-O)-methylase SpoU